MSQLGLNFPKEQIESTISNFKCLHLFMKTTLTLFHSIYSYKHPRVFARSHWHHCDTDKLSFHASMQQQSWHYCKLGVTVSVLY